MSSVFGYYFIFPQKFLLHTVSILEIWHDNIRQGMISENLATSKPFFFISKMERYNASPSFFSQEPFSRSTWGHTTHPVTSRSKNVIKKFFEKL